MEPKEEIRNRLDVADVIGEYFELKKAGTSLKACCPFHSEKTPSFNVSKEKQIWHCFGCGVGGDIFAFVMQMEGIDFPEALRLLAKKAGVEIPRYSSTQSNERSKQVEANTLACKYFEKVYLESDSAKTVREYVESRGIPEELREEFGIGFAPDQWDALVGVLKKREYTDSEIMGAGLAFKSKKSGSVIDRFRNRLMIPLHDAHGNVVGFTGRIMPGAPENSGPKYMNSPETDAYHKSDVLYGLHKAKQAIKLEKSVIIVEGNLDVVASHKAGVKNVVASSGTALTESQINLLKRYTDTLLFCFDQDAAGFKAAIRGIHLAMQNECNVKVLLVPESAGKDPDEVVQKNPSLWREIVKKPIPIMEYYFTHATRGRDLSDVEMKRSVGRFLIDEIARIQDKIEQEHWLTQLADILRTNVDVLRTMVSDIQKGIKTPEPSTDKKTAAVVLKKAETRYDKAFSGLFSVFMQFPSQRQSIRLVVSKEMVPKNGIGTLYEKAVLTYDADKQNIGTQKSFFAELSKDLTEEEQNLLAYITFLGEELVSQMSVSEVPPYLQEHIYVLNDEFKKNRLQELQQSLRVAEASGDNEAIQSLLEEFKSL
ncbi:MAG: DNA primase [bacterium]|nr:DNA primase [bacterium]